MTKFKEFCKKNYIAIIIVIACLLIIIGSIVLIRLINANKNKVELRTSSEKLYYYVGDSKIRSTYKVNYENEQIVSIKNNKYSIGSNCVTYFADEDSHVIIPKKSEIVLTKSNMIYKSLDKYSEIYKSNDNNIVINKGKKINSYNFFIYDGEDLYFFPNAVTVKVNGVEYSLSAYSYVVINNIEASIYDYATDTITYIDSKITSASAVCDNYKVDLYNDCLLKGEYSYSLAVNIDKIGIYKEA